MTQQQQRRRAPVPTYIICILFVLGCTVFALSLALYTALSAGLDDLVDGSFRPTFLIDKEGILFLREKDVPALAKAEIKTAVKRQRLPEEEANELLNDGQLYELVESIVSLYTPQADIKKLVDKIETLKKVPGLEAKYQKAFLQPVLDYTIILPKGGESDPSTEKNPNMRGSFVGPQGVACGDDDTDRLVDSSDAPKSTDEKLNGPVYNLQALFEPEEASYKSENALVEENILAATADPNEPRAGCRSRTVSGSSFSSANSSCGDNGACTVEKKKETVLAPSASAPCLTASCPGSTKAVKKPSDCKVNDARIADSKDAIANGASVATPEPAAPSLSAAV